MSKLGSHYINTPTTFGEIPYGVKFTLPGGYLCERYSPFPHDGNPAINTVNVDTRERLVLEDSLEVVAWMPKAWIDQCEREQTSEWKQRFEEIQEGIEERYRNEESEFFPDGWRDRELRFIPVR